MKVSSQSWMMLHSALTTRANARMAKALAKVTRGSR